jgi:hypothetical protein
MNHCPAREQLALLLAEQLSGPEAKRRFQNPGRAPISAVGEQLYKETRPWIRS